MPWLRPSYALTITHSLRADCHCSEVPVFQRQDACMTQKAALEYQKSYEPIFA